MPLTFPLAPSAWMDKLAVEEIVFDTDEAVEASETAAGEYMVKRLGPTLWGGEIRLFPLRHDCGAGRAAMLGALRHPGASFLVYNKLKQYPADDPTGSKLGSASPSLNSVNASGELSISGLPTSYKLTAGDYLGWTYGSNPTRYALHRVVVDKTASGGLVTGLVVDPMPRAGWSAGATVTLIRPVCKAVIVPGGASKATFGRVAMASLTFRWQQTLR